MGKEIFFASQIELEEYRKTIHSNLTKSLQKLKTVFESNDPVEAFDACKYDKIVFDPLTGQNENLIEMLNQHQTYLVTLKAVEYLLNKYPEKSFLARFGNIAGYDVESTDGEVIAECFAAVNFRNNQKLDKDLEKLDSVNRNVSCYEFFYDKVFEHKDYALYETKFPGIQIVKFENLK